MNRNTHGRLISGIILIFMISIIYTDSANGQEIPISVTPLSTVSIFVQSKDTDPIPDNPNIGQTTPPDNGADITTDGGFPIPFPEADFSFEKVCSPTIIGPDDELNCTLTLQNKGAEDLSYKVLDITSYNLSIQEDSLVGGELHRHNIITHRGTLAGGLSSGFMITNTDTPLAYNSLSDLGVSPFTDVEDETIINLSTLQPYIFDNEEYSTIAMTSNGYLIAGLGSDEDIAYTPQIFPDPVIPNNVIAPFWTDLNPEAGGNLYGALLTRDGESWVVLEWEDVPAFDSDKPAPNCGGSCAKQSFTFQVWIKTNTTEQDVTYIYERVDSAGAASGLNIGVEDQEGNIGTNYESLPEAGDELLVLSTPGSEGETHVISYTARPKQHTGPWYSCAVMKMFEVRGFAFNCSFGTIAE